MAEFTIDFHTHLLEKGVKPEAYWKAVKAKKLDAVAITEHSFEKPEKAYKMLLEKKPKGITLIPGLEISSEIGHLIVLGKDKSIYNIESLFKKGIPIKEAIAIAKVKGLLLIIAHPWGFSNDSAAYLLGEKKLKALIKKEKIGIEIFNGMFGNVSSAFYATNWIRKPMNFFDFLEKSRIGKKTRLSKLGKKGKEKLDKKGKEILERCAKPFELSEKATFVTAGSDAHSPKRIGTGIVKLEAKGKDVENILKAIQNKKNVKWIGPYVKKTNNGYTIEKASVQKKEILSGLKYATTSKIVKKIKRKKKLQ